MTLADTLIYHSAAMVNMLNEPQTPQNPPKATTKSAKNIEQLLSCLPDSFDFAKAVECGEMLDIGRTTVYRYLRQMQEEGLLELRKHIYYKV